MPCVRDRDRYIVLVLLPSDTDLVLSDAGLSIAAETLIRGGHLMADLVRTDVLLWARHLLPDV